MSKATRITALVLKLIPSLMLLMSAAMKLAHTQQIVELFSKSALINYLTLIGIIELVSVMLFLIPKTAKAGFLLLCSYLGGAMSIELAAGEFPIAAFFIALIWLSAFLTNREMFLSAPKKNDLQ